MRMLEVGAQNVLAANGEGWQGLHDSKRIISSPAERTPEGRGVGHADVGRGCFTISCAPFKTCLQAWVLISRG